MTDYKRSVRQNSNVGNLLGRSVTVMPVEFSVPVVAGIETYLSCPSGLQLSGPETATCMKNGE